MTLFSEFLCHFLCTCGAGSHGAVDGVCYIFLVEHVHGTLGSTFWRGDCPNKLLGSLARGEKHFGRADNGLAYRFEKGAVVTFKPLSLGGLHNCIYEVVEVCR